MKSWPTLILVLLVLGLLSYIFFDLKNAPSTSEAEENSKRVFQFKPDQVDHMELTNATGDMVFSRQGHKWMIEKPIQFPGEPYSIDRILSTLADLQRLATIRDIPLNQAVEQFALKEPKIQVFITIAGQTTSLALGKPTPATGGIYALLTTGQKKEVIVVTDTLSKGLEKGLDEWRGHTVVDLPMDEVDGIVLRREQGETEVREKDDKWQIIKPLVTAADPDEVDKFLRDVGSIRAAKFVSETEGNSPTYGLNAPTMILELYHKGKVNRLKIGANPKDEPDIWYASYDPRPVVFTLTRPSIELIQNLLDAVRDKKIAAPEVPSDVLKLKLTTKDFSLDLHRDPVTPTTWRMEDGTMLDMNPVEQFLSQFLMAQVVAYPAGTQAQAFSPAKKIATVELTYTAPVPGIHQVKPMTGKTLPPTKTETIVLAPGLKNDPKAPIFASTPEQNGPVFINSNLLKLLPDQPWAWLSREVIGIPDPITALTWKNSSGETTLTLQGAQEWKVTQGKGNMDQNLLNLQLTVLKNLKVERWIGPPGKNDFKKPLGSLLITRGKKTQLLEFGASLTDKTVVTRLNENPWAFLMTDRDFRLLSEPPVSVNAPSEPPAPAAPTH